MWSTMLPHDSTAVFFDMLFLAWVMVHSSVAEISKAIVALLMYLTRHLLLQFFISLSRPGLYVSFNFLSCLLHSDGGPLLLKYPPN